MGRIRKPLEGIDIDATGDAEKQMALSGQLEQLMAYGAAPWQETIRMGRSFYANTTAALASVVALPTTANLLSIWNGEPDGGRSYVIDWVGAINIVAGAATGQSEIIANIGQTRVAALAVGGGNIKRMNGLGTGNDTKAIISIANLDAVTGVAQNWFPLGSAVGKPGAVAVGPSMWIPVDGRIIVPPGRIFAIHTFSDIVTDTFQGFISWTEKTLVLG